MLKRHRIFNEIIAYWEANGQSSTPRRGELLRWMRAHNVRMARKTLRDHLDKLVTEGYIRFEDTAIVLIRKVAIADPAESDASEVAAIQAQPIALD